MELRDKILEVIAEVAELSDCELVSDIADNTILLESGLDSLGFAILVARLEEELNYDPFAEMEDAVYPSTFAEFVSIYSKNSKLSK